jgi:hypothetical protein
MLRILLRLLVRRSQESGVTNRLTSSMNVADVKSLLLVVGKIFVNTFAGICGIICVIL